MSAAPVATVVGGGIAGLAAAASLLRAGWRVRVLERAAATVKAGSALLDRTPPTARDEPRAE